MLYFEYDVSGKVGWKTTRTERKGWVQDIAQGLLRSSVSQNSGTLISLARWNSRISGTF